MRIAVLDLLLHYPPQGGACVDIFNTFSRLSSEFEIKLFCPRWDAVLPRGIFKTPPPLPVEAVEPDRPTRNAIVEKLLQKVSAWKPELVFIADGWTLKPYLACAFKEEFPTIIRFYAFECLCPRNNERWLPSGKCPNHALLDCGKCLKCADEYGKIVREKKGSDNPLTEEARIAEIFSGDYSKTLVSSLQNTPSIVYNHSTAKLLGAHSKTKPFVVHGGVDAEFFKASRRRDFEQKKPFRILVPGRMDDPAKGASSAIEAGRLLEEKGLSFELRITSRQSANAHPWLKEIGWKSQDELKSLVENSDCVVVPSLWDEAFGMAWTEAMSMGAPVVASATPGPLEGIVEHKNGLLFPPGDAQALASCIEELSASPELRRKLSEAGRETACNSFSWDHSAAQTRKAILSSVEQS
ncbi:MAG: hypothetical protein A2X49_17175 [Lentisphaerae bacterium GWF2_52_8]|nr:MAG: hypothetical protein A2X49_17175 [Lentisphaerae bacterium GWF2_52_8]